MFRKLDLTKEHKNLKLTPCNYLHGLSVPSTVKVFITLDEEHDLTKASPLKNNSILRLKKNGIYLPPQYLYLHTVGISNSSLELQTDVIYYNNNSYIEIEQQDNQTMNLTEEVTDSLILNEVSKVNAFSAELLTALDKISNPYQEPTYTQGLSSGSVIASETLLDKVLTCDKVTINLGMTYNNAEHSYGSNEAISAYIDGVCVARLLIYGGTPSMNIPYFKGLNTNGRTLTIKAGANSTAVKMHYTIQEFNKKV